jgi:hypothetical protein
MPTQKTFKRRVRARMTKTGESYTTARHQLVRKGDPATGAPESSAPATTDEPATAEETITAADTLQSDLLTSDEAMVRGSGKGHAAWFALLDAWGATGQRHTRIATWLREEQGVPGWWAQNITVAYERARGMRGKHQMADGFSIAVTRTVGADAIRALGAFTDPDVRRRWLPDARMEPRPTRARGTARFDWADPPSRVVVTVVVKAPDRTIVALGHEKLPDAATAERFKASWRTSLGALKRVLEED